MRFVSLRLSPQRFDSSAHSDIDYLKHQTAWLVALSKSVYVWCGIECILVVPVEEFWDLACR